MFKVIDTCHSDNVHFETNDFDEALANCLYLAQNQAIDEGMREEDVGSYENGVDPRNYPEGQFFGQWNAGACPKDCDGAYWPKIVWVDE